MKIQWLGHSCFRLEESTGTSIIIDPYHPYVGYEMPKVKADVVTMSHGHKDHSYLGSIEGNPQIIDKAGFYEVGGVHMYSQKSYHDDEKGAKRGENLIFKYRLDGVDICHMGDIGEECNPMLVEKLMPIDVLMIPVGGTYTIDAEQAKEYIDKLMPDIVLPMHYKTKDCEFDIDRLDNFLDLFDEKDIIYMETDTLEYDRADFDGQDTKIVILEKPN